MTARRAFRLYARLGLHRMQNWTVADFRRLFGICRTDTLSAMLAVRDTLRALQALGDTECINAVMYVYMSERGRTPGKSETSRRVLSFALARYCDERTVYRKLYKACRMYRNLLQNSEE